MIQLTDESGAPCWISPNHIVGLRRAELQNKTIVYTDEAVDADGDGNSWGVRETPEEILAQLEEQQHG